MIRRFVSHVARALRVTLVTHAPRVTHRFMLIAIVSALVVSCSQAPSGAHGQVLVAWHTLSGIQEQVLLDLVDQWNRANAYGITVVPERRDPGSLNGSIQQGLAQKALPGLMLVSTAQAASYYQRGILTPLDSFIANTPGDGWDVNDRADLYPFVLKAGITGNGQTIGVPFGGTVRLMFFNRDWIKPLGLDDAPATWDQYTAACGTATDRAKGTLCFGIDPNATAFEQWLLAHGGQVTTNNLSVLQVSTPSSLQAMNRMSAFVRAGEAYRVTTRTQSRDDFASSRVLFTFDWSDQLNDIGQAVKQHGDFDWGTGLLPAAEGRPQITQLRAPLWVIARLPGVQNPDRENAAWLFIRWLLDGPQTAQWASQTGELPSRMSAAKIMGAKTALTPNEVTVLRTIAPLAHPDPLVSGLTCVENVLSNAMRQIFDGQPVTDTLQLAQATGQAELTMDCSSQ